MCHARGRASEMLKNAIWGIILHFPNENAMIMIKIGAVVYSKISISTHDGVLVRKECGIIRTGG